MNKNIVIGVVVVAVLALGGWWLYSMNQPATPNNQTGTINNPDQTNHNSPAHYEVIYTDNGYSPESVTINVGDTVTWKNQSSGGDWVASGNHPTHTLYSGTALQAHCPDSGSSL